MFSYPTKGGQYRRTPSPTARRRRSSEASKAVGSVDVRRAASRADNGW